MISSARCAGAIAHRSMPAPLQNTSPRRASMQATSTPSPQSRASSVPTPWTGTDRAKPSARADARPIRSPVKVPGPVPTTIASSCDGSTAAVRIRWSTSSSRCWAAVERPAVADSASTSPSRHRQAVAVSVAVSSESSSKGVQQTRIVAGQRDQPSIALQVVDVHRDTRIRQQPGPGVGPLDERDRILEVGLEVGPFLDGEAARAVEVEVRDADAVRPRTGCRPCRWGW